MVIDTTIITVEQIGSFKKKLEEILRNDKHYGIINTEDDIETLTNFMLALSKKNATLKDILEETGIGTYPEGKHSRKELSTFEKSIQSIAIAEQIDKILEVSDKTKGHVRVKSYIRASLSTKSALEHKSADLVGQHVYNKFRKVIDSRVARVKKSTQVKELCDRYPDLDIEKVISIGVAHGKIEMTSDYMEWLEQTISVLCKK